MDINKNTRISELIKENKASIDAIASLAKPLEKLKNPVLRRIMASRVTLTEAAQMGGCSLDDFIRVLRPLGFQFVDPAHSSATPQQERPAWLERLAENQIQVFDVRPILASGEDPLKQIVKRFKELPEGQALCIINTFVPVPLVRLLEKDGVRCFTETMQPNEFHTFFYKERPSPHAVDSDIAAGNVITEDQDSFDQLCQQFAPGLLQEIDVRHLEMPQPMQTILAKLPQLPDGGALFVHHKRVPLYLLEEIAGQAYRVHIRSIEEGNVKLLIYAIDR